MDQISCTLSRQIQPNEAYFAKNKGINPVDSLGIVENLLFSAHLILPFLTTFSQTSTR